MEDCKVITATGFSENIGRSYVYEGWLESLGLGLGESMDKKDFSTLMGHKDEIMGDERYYKEQREICLQFVKNQPDGTKFMIVPIKNSDFDPYNFPIGKERIQGEYRFYDNQ